MHASLDSFQFVEYFGTERPNYKLNYSYYIHSYAAKASYPRFTRPNVGQKLQ